MLPSSSASAANDDGFPDSYITSHVSRAARRDSRFAAFFGDALELTPDADELDAMLRSFQGLDCADGHDEPGLPFSLAAAASAERDDERPARSVATESERARVDKRLLDALPPEMVLRTSQARHMVAIQRGDDRILIAATGSGKGATMFAPAIADYVDRVRARADLSAPRPVDLVLIPMANMGVPHAEAFNALLASALVRAGHDVGGGKAPGALYVERDSTRADPDGAAAAASTAPADGAACSTVCPAGHRLEHHQVWRKRALLDALCCDRCGGVIPPDEARFSCAMCDYDSCVECARPPDFFTMHACTTASDS